MGPIRLNELGDLLLCLYRAATEQPLEAFQDVALSIMKPALPFDSSMWGTATISSNVDPATQFAHWVSLYRRDPDAQVEQRERGLLELLAPHMMQALAVNRLAHLNRLRSNPSGASANLAIADGHGVLYHADATFEGLMRAEWSGWDSRRLPASVLEHFSRDGTPFRGETMVVRCSTHHGLLFLKARSRRPVDNLTERERTIARLLAEGGTHKHVARVLNRSPATVRNQTKAIYEKLGVNNVAALVTQLGFDD